MMRNPPPLDLGDSDPQLTRSALFSLRQKDPLWNQTGASEAKEAETLTSLIEAKSAPQSLLNHRHYILNQTSIMSFVGLRPQKVLTPTAALDSMRVLFECEGQRQFDFLGALKSAHRAIESRQPKHLVWVLQAIFKMKQRYKTQMTPKTEMNFISNLLKEQHTSITQEDMNRTIEEKASQKTESDDGVLWCLSQSITQCLSSKKAANAQLLTVAKTSSHSHFENLIVTRGFFASTLSSFLNSQSYTLRSRLDGDALFRL